MTLSEIETILGELAARHQDLTEEMLRTLLLSAGWEDKIIKDALMLFKQQKTNVSVVGKVSEKKEVVSQVVSSPVIGVGGVSPTEEKVKEKDDITFYHPDGAEEGKLRVIQGVAQPQREEPHGPGPLSFFSAFFGALFGAFTMKSPSTQKGNEFVVYTPPPVSKPPQRVSNKAPTPPLVTPAEPKVVIVPPPPVLQPIVITALPVSVKPVADPAPQVEQQPVSLITHEEPVQQKVTSKEVEIPGNLPLLPFESSPHVWSFSRYKDVFHGETVPKKVEDKPLPQEKEVINPPQEVIQEEVSKKHQEESPDEEITLERTPLTKGDESLVFLAGVMLLVIILILGYMYNNGRL